MSVTREAPHDSPSSWGAARGPVTQILQVQTDLQQKQLTGQENKATRRLQQKDIMLLFYNLFLSYSQQIKLFN